jgi:MFS family permease
VIAAWFPSGERGVAGAIFNSAQYVSLVIFTPLMGWLDHMFGWEHIFSVMGVLGVIIAAVRIFGYFAPPDHPSVTEAEIAGSVAGFEADSEQGRRRP